MLAEDIYKRYYSWVLWIDEKVTKRSKKPFKGGHHIVTVLEVTINQYSNKLAFKVTDGETESIVDCFQCELVKPRYE